MELEGLEYLSFHEARVEFTSGRLQIKLENFNDNFQKTYKQSNPTLAYNSTSSESVFGLTGGYNNADNLTANSDGTWTDSNYQVNKDVRRNKGNGQIDGRQKFGSKSFVSNSSFGKTYEPTPIPAKAKAMGIFVIYDLYKGVQDFIDTKAMVDDKVALDKQMRSWEIKDSWSGEVLNSNNSVVGQVLKNLQYAVKTGIIKKENINVKDMTDIANIVMFGGNGNESKNIGETAEKIINEVSSSVAKFRLLNSKAQTEQIEKVNSWSAPSENSSSSQSPKK
ncbi:hypothetical protein B8T70_21090 [Flavobacterium sp. AJR]|nr:hypothetical protein B8T70_21090 [Flavobacterium sp. AJR]